MRLKSVSIEETRGEELDIKISELTLNELNLLISDNAQGKTRLFRIFNYLKSLVTGTPRNIATKFHSSFIFLDGDDNKDEIQYELTIEPIEGKNSYKENIIRNSVVIYNSEDKTLLNELTNSPVESIFLPKNIPAISSINDDEYPTIKKINDFFSKIVFISSNRTREIDLNPESILPNEFGSNISNVLLNWSRSYPEIFKEILIDFKECFRFIEDVVFTEDKIGGISMPIISIKEKDIDKLILLREWSDGMYRTLHLLMLARIPFNSNANITPPSLILVDEVENGLDFKTLKIICNYFKDYMDESQIIISSHSPLVCDFIHPKYWKIAKRAGSLIKFKSPEEVENNLTETLDTFKQSHWEFYTKHISNSSLYVIK